MVGDRDLWCQDVLRERLGRYADKYDLLLKRRVQDATVLSSRSPSTPVACAAEYWVLGLGSTAAEELTNNRGTTDFAERVVIVASGGFFGS